MKMLCKLSLYVAIFILCNNLGLNEAYATCKEIASQNIPDGFEVQMLDVGNTRILKPKGWFYYYFFDGYSIVWTICKENPRPDGYKTGLRIQYTWNMSKASKMVPGNYVKQFISDKRKTTEVIKECSVESSGKLNKTCLETKENSNIPGLTFHILYTIAWSDEDDTWLQQTFGAPDQDWESVQSIASQMQRCAVDFIDLKKK